MGIQFVELEKINETEFKDAELKVLSDETEVEAKYVKCGETGDVRVTIEDFDDLPTEQLVLLTLKDHDGKDSEYRGVIRENGLFVSA